MMTFEQLYTTYFADVFRFALWLSRNRSEAEDMTSETFVRAWAQRRRLRTETLKGYLLAIVRSIFLAQRSRANGREQLPAELPDRTPDPHRQAAARITLERVWRLMARLSEQDRTALILRSDQSLPYAEIARVLGISEGAARVKVHRARRRLLELSLQGQEQGGNHERDP